MASMRGRGANILYLDFDGVLHPDDVRMHTLLGPRLAKAEDHSLFENARLLEELLEPYPALRIVLSTHWVARFGLGFATRNLRPALRLRVIGATYRPGMALEAFLAVPKGQQVVNDVTRRKPSGWIAVDDNDRGWPAEHSSRLVASHRINGIAEPAVRHRLVDALAELHAEGPGR